MADATTAALVRLVGGNEIAVKAGGKITNDGAQAATIADVAALTGGESPTEAEFNALATKFNAVLAALEGVGILASS